MSDSWDEIAGWWVEEVLNDPAYGDDVHPVLSELLYGTGGTAIDLGCGEGQGIRLVGGSVIGTDHAFGLLRHARLNAPVVQAKLPDLSWVRTDSFSLAYSVYLLDLIADHQGFFDETARIVRSGGHLVVVINHPVYTAPGSAPLMDDDGEILWRWGSYFTEGSSSEPAGEATVEFHHRPLNTILSAASRSGWALEQMVERGLSAQTVARFPEYIGQEQIPRIAGFRWVRQSTGLL
ncbi:MAG: class I SAM-dependent methyltransferase [Actinomycetia bacterium]|nr:class I SAM-dependent methyltransferase [Actinomycetes bacterium]